MDTCGSNCYSAEGDLMANYWQALMGSASLVSERFWQISLIMAYSTSVTAAGFTDFTQCTHLVIDLPRTLTQEKPFKTLYCTV